MQHPFRREIDEVLDRLSQLAMGAQAETIRHLVKEARELNGVNESTIAMENLCDNLQELPAVRLTEEVCRDIMGLARAMGLRGGYEELISLIG
jgi:hypothetical protein